MSDGNELPDVNEQAPASCSSANCRFGSSIMRAMIYTPVILGLSSLAGLAMFPDLADHLVPASEGSASGCCSSSEGNPNCPIQMLLRAFSPRTKLESKPLSKPQSSETDLFSEQVAFTEQANLQSINCCPSSRGCLRSLMESNESEKVANETISASEEPTDALAAIVNNQQLPENQEQAPASN